MPRVCTTCLHPQREEIDRELIRQAATKRSLALRYGLVPMSLYRHEARHLDPMLIEAHKRSLEAEGSANYRLARDNVNDALSDLRQMREAFVVNGKVIPHRELLDVMDRFLKANEQWARINRESGNDEVTALFIQLGVRDQVDLERRVESSRLGEDMTPAQVLEEVLSTLEMVVHKEPHLWHIASERLQRMSRAQLVETNGNGSHKANGAG